MASEKTPYQSLCIDFIYSLFSDDAYRQIIESQAVKEIVKYLIRHYPEYTHDNRKTYQNLDAYITKFRHSEKAEEILKKYQNGNMSKREVIKLLEYEHMPPVEVIFKDIVRLANKEIIRKEDIVDIFQKNKFEVVIISKNEARELNGNGLRDLGDCELRLNAIGAKISKESGKNSL